MQRPLQKRNMIALAKKFMLNQKQSSTILGIPYSSYIKLRPESSLSVAASNVVLYLAELYEIGTTTFDNDSKSFVNWLQGNNPELKGITPASLLTSPFGIEQLREMLLRMEYSISA
jgi:uncharacterized protein (DUF2384 family)